jgi:hypothetical protein
MEQIKSIESVTVRKVGVTKVELIFDNSDGTVICYLMTDRESEKLRNALVEVAERKAETSGFTC